MVRKMYRHYWERKDEEHDMATWIKFVADVKTIYNNLPPKSMSSGGHYKNEILRVADWNGQGKPTFSNHEICFNGHYYNNLDSHTFYIARKIDKKWDVEAVKFYLNYDAYAYNCNTEHKPYDLFVQTTLLLYKYHFKGKVVVKSDGSIKDWAVARTLLNKVLDYGIIMKVTANGFDFVSASAVESALEDALSKLDIGCSPRISDIE
jgi:hypothetical protein